jgi:hypothetical protein
MNAIDITTLQAVKNFVEITSTKDDSTIAGLITSFSQWALTYCSRETLSGILTFDEIYDGNGSDQLFLRNSPVQALLAVFINATQVPLSTSYGVGGVFVGQLKKSIAVRQGLSGSFSSLYYPTAGGPAFLFSKGRGNVRVQYTAGYPPTQILNESQIIANQTITLADGPWSNDLGVVAFPSLTPFTLVPNSPAQGQYAVSGGIYVFNALDNGASILVSYYASKPPADLELVARRTVGTAYKRRQWLDQASKTLSAQGATGTTRYRDWKLEPIDQVTMNEYRRVAVS